LKLFKGKVSKQLNFFIAGLKEKRTASRELPIKQGRINYPDGYLRERNSISNEKIIMKRIIETEKRSIARTHQTNRRHGKYKQMRRVSAPRGCDEKRGMFD